MVKQKSLEPLEFGRHHDNKYTSEDFLNKDKSDPIK